MYRHTIRAITFIALVAALAACQTFRSPDVTLILTADGVTYRVGEPIKLQATLRNNTQGPLRFSPRWQGTITVTSLTRDGATVIAKETGTHFETELAHTLEHALAEVPAAQSISIPWGTETDGAIAGQVLQTVKSDANTPHSTLLYPINQPGSYSLTVAYRYPAGTGGHANVYQGTVQSTEVRFRVIP